MHPLLYLQFMWIYIFGILYLNLKKDNEQKSPITFSPLFILNRIQKAKFLWNMK